MRLNGWHRLWVLLSLIAAVALAGIAALVWPDSSSVPDSIGLHDKFSPAARAQITEFESEAGASVRMPNGHVIHLRSGIEASRMTEALVQYQQGLLENARAKQVELVLKLAAWWLSVSIAVLLLGHLIAWVRAGFAMSTP